jgi:hypothetical protein
VITAILFALAVEVVPAQAGYCGDMKGLRSKVRHCDDNSQYQEASVACIEKFDKEIAEATKVFGAALLRPKTAGQSESQVKASGGYAAMEKVLDLLMENGRKGLDALLAFERNIVFPEDIDSEEAVGGNLDRFLYESDCYRETYEVLFAVRADFQEKLGQLAAARGVAVTGKAAADGRAEKLSGTNDAVVPAAGIGAGGGGAGRKVRDSDISGTEEKRD